MRLEAVSVCINYADFLDAIAPYNLSQLDRWLIVTSEHDHETREVCRKWSIETLLTEEHKRDGAKFAKGRLVEAGLRQLSQDSWHLHIDCDIVLPRSTRRMLEVANLNERKIYGCHRFNVKGWQRWQDLQKSGWLDKGTEYQFMRSFPRGFEIGSQLVFTDSGYVPIGYFQLFHPDAVEFRGARVRRYPMRHGNGCRTDAQFSLLWDRRDRELLPEIIVGHLESDGEVKMGANWSGRTTSRFSANGGPPPVVRDANGHSGY